MARWARKEERDKASKRMKAKHDDLSSVYNTTEYKVRLKAGNNTPEAKLNKSKAQNPPATK